MFALSVRSDPLRKVDKDPNSYVTCMLQSCFDVSEA
jgi:hypothetical protein